MKVGFTGTRHGLSEWQRKRLREFLRFHRPEEFHHGDCQGADAQAHKMVRDLLPECRIVVHPGHLPKWRAGCKGDDVREPCDTLVRNGRIVRETDEMVAAPETTNEQLRSGTWSTIRLARSLGYRVELLERDAP